MPLSLLEPLLSQAALWDSLFVEGLFDPERLASLAKETALFDIVCKNACQVCPC